MIKYSFFISLLVLIFQSNVSAQMTMTGTIFDNETNEPIESVIVLNKNSQNHTISDSQGNYQIYCNFKDTIVVKILGYRTIEFVVNNYGTFAFKRNFYLFSIIEEMDEVVINSKSAYQIDSINRAKTYELTLERQFVSGAGAVFSPATALGQLISKKSKQVQKFQKNFKNWEEEKYNETIYTSKLVASVVPLTGDSLAFFMNAYPIAHDFARAATVLELKMWIKYNYTEWIKEKKIPLLNQMKTN